MRRWILVGAVLATACGPARYALSPTQEAPEARWADGALAARAQLAREHGNCPVEWIFVRERGVDDGGGQRSGSYEVYGCARQREYRCIGDGREVACR